MHYLLVCYHSEIEGNDEAGNRQRRVVKKGSLREKLPPSLKIKSTDLRLLNPIGQGTYTNYVETVPLLHVAFNHDYQENLA